MNQQNNIPLTKASQVQLRGDNKISPGKAQKILMENGMSVNKEQAKMIVDFLYKIAELSKA